MRTRAGCEARRAGRAASPPVIARRSARCELARRALATRAEVRASLPDDDAADRRRAARTRRARAVVDLELVLVRARIAARRAIERVEARAFARDRVLERRPDRRMQPARRFAIDARRARERMELGREQ